jgi:hypothetical protein
MSWVLKLLLFCLLSSVFLSPAKAQTGCVPNPNASDNPFVNGCSLPVSGLNAAIPTINPMSAKYGAKCDNVTADQAAINSAASDLSALGGGMVLIPPNKFCGYSGTVHVPANVKLVGGGHRTSGLTALSANLTGVSLDGNYSGVESLVVNCGAAGANSSGNCINVAAGVREILIKDYALLTPFVGISTTTAVLVTIKDGYIINPTATTGECILINGGNNQVVYNNFCQGVQLSQPRAGIEIQASQGAWLDNNQTLFTGVGELIDPGTGQTVTWIFETRGTYDTGSGNGISISPSGSGIVRGFTCVECWTSTNTLSGFVVQPSNTASVDGVEIVAHRSFNNQNYGATFAPLNTATIKNATVKGGFFCGNSGAASNTYDGIFVGVVTDVNITGARSGPCAGFSDFQRYGININGATANNIVMVGNDLNGNLAGRAAINFPNSAIATIQNNSGIDDQMPTVASATTITAPLNPTFFVSGSTVTQNILGGWQGRVMTMIPTGAVPFNSGGTSGQDIAVSVTGTANVPNIAALAGSHWYVK